MSAETTYGLDSRRLAKLLQIGDTDDKPARPAQAAPVSARPKIARSTPKVLSTVRIQPAFFEVLAGLGKGQILPVLADDTLVGRGIRQGAKPGHIAFDPGQRDVSRHQARLCRDPKGRLHLVNLSDPAKKAATTVNGKPLTLNATVLLGEGDRVQMGSIVLKFHQAVGAAGSPAGKGTGNP